MVSNIWIEDILRYTPSFYGVFSSDNISPPQFYPSSSIVNFSSQKELGTYFATLLFDSPYSCKYFDPLDLSFIPQNILEFLETYFPTNFDIIHFKIQHSLSNFCGIYCMLACLLHGNNIPVTETLEEYFLRDRLNNDKKVVRIFCKIIRNSIFFSKLIAHRVRFFET